MLWSPQLIIPRRKPAAAAAAWTPASLSNLLAWYKADTGVYSDAGTTLATDTQTVQQWNDQSGNGYHLLQATSGRRPQYLSAGFNSKQTVKFTSATPTGMVTATNVVAGFGTNASGFFVGQLLTGTASNARAVSLCKPFASDTDANSCIMGFRNAGGDAIASYRGGVVASQAVSLATNLRFGVVYDGANGTSYLNNANATATANTNAFDSTDGTYALGVGIELINDRAFGNLGWDGPISEVVITLGALSSGDRNSLDSYFQTHWGL